MGSFLICTGYVVGVSKSAACISVGNVIQVWPSQNFALQWFRMPKTNNEIEELKKQFYGVPKCLLVIGAILTVPQLYSY